MKAKSWKPIKRLVALGAAVLIALSGAMPIASQIGIVQLQTAEAMAGSDDYPAKYKNARKDALVDAWRFYNRECTSFVAWRLNNDNSVPFHNYYKGVHWGDAKHWGPAARKVGIKVDMSPAIGSVGWRQSGTYGHVTWVKGVKGDKVTIEEYNRGGTGVYSTRTVSKSAFTGFIHIKDLSGSSTPTTCSFEYNNNGGSGSFATATVSAGGKLTVPSAKPTKKGNIFKGWAAKRVSDQKWHSRKGWVSKDAVSANGGFTYYQPGTKLSIDDSWLKGCSKSTVKFRFYAHWQTVKSTVYFSANGGTGSYGTITKTYGSEFMMPASKPTRSGYTFKGWALKRLGDQKWISTKGTWHPVGDVASNGGFRLYACGKERTLAPSWYTGLEGVNVNFRFYAQWEKNSAVATHAVTYNLNGGTGSYSSTTVAHGAKFTFPSTKPVNYGYVFKGWAVQRVADSLYDTSKGWVASSAVTANGGYKLFAAGHQTTFGDSWTAGCSNASTGFKLYAQWAKAKGSFSFGLNGGEGSFGSFSSTFGDTFTLPSAKPTRYGYTFKGWALKRTSDDKWYTVNGGWQDYGNVSAKGGYNMYPAGASRALNKSWFNGWSGGDASFRFYAQYTLNAGMQECTITYGLNGGSGTFATQTVAYGGKLTFHAATPTKKGYVFKGWAAKRLNDSKWRSGYGRWVTASEIPDYDGYRLYQPNGTITLDAAWSKQYTGTDKNYNYRLFAQWAPAS